jgi:hypothetical protein
MQMGKGEWRPGACPCPVGAWRFSIHVGRKSGAGHHRRGVLQNPLSIFMKGKALDTEQYEIHWAYADCTLEALGPG